jgi:hypothetical protein
MVLSKWYGDEYGSCAPKDGKRRDWTYTAKRASRDEFSEPNERILRRIVTRKKASVPGTGNANIDVVG